MLAAMVQEHERGLGGWHAEWESLPDLVRLTAGALHHLTTTVSALDIDSERMRQNLDITQGLIFAEAVAMALAEKMPRSDAHDLVQKACKRAQSARRDLRSVLAQDAIIKANLPEAELDRLFAPTNYLGVADQFVDFCPRQREIRHCAVRVRQECAKPVGGHAAARIVGKLAAGPVARSRSNSC